MICEQYSVAVFMPLILRQAHPAAVVIKKLRILELLDYAPFGKVGDRIFALRFSDYEQLPRLDIKRGRRPPRSFNEPIHIGLSDGFLPKLFAIAPAAGDCVKYVHVMMLLQLEPTRHEF